jgi:hypothetical protein
MEKNRLKKFGQQNPSLSLAVQRHGAAPPLMFNAIMDAGIEIALALLLLAATVRAATNGNPIPGYILALIAGVYAIYFVQQEEMHSLIMLAWVICGTAIFSAYVGRQVGKIKNA